MSSIAAINLALKFVLELAALSVFAIWGAVTGPGAWAVVLAVAAPGAFVVLWGRFAAPRAAHRLPVASRIPFELTLLGLACPALVGIGATGPAIAFACALVVNAAGAFAFQQWSA